LLDCNDPNCGRLAPALRSAAPTRDAREILLRSAVGDYAARHPHMPPPGTTSSLALAQALADLAVTGRAAYDVFRGSAFRAADLTPPLRTRLLTLFPTHTPVLPDVVGAVHQALFRSYQVAWALRGPTPYRQAHRAELGWIAVEAEDDPPHRPVNIPSAPYPQY